MKSIKNMPAPPEERPSPAPLPPVPVPVRILAIPLAAAAEPTIPLTDQARLDYQLLANKLHDELWATNDDLVIDTLTDARTGVNEVLTKDAIYRLHANTEQFSLLLEAIQDTNADLLTLKNRIAAVASHMADAAGILEAVDKVLSLVPGL